MKKSTKIFSLILAVALLVCATACGGSDSSSAPQTVSSQLKTTYFNGTSEVEINRDQVLSAISKGTMDVTYSNGDDIIRNAQVTLGQKTEEIFNEFTGDFTRYEKDNFVYYDNMKSRLYFVHDGTDSGVVAISSFSTVFNFEPNMMAKADVVNIMGEPNSQGETPQAVSKSLFRGEKGTYCSYVSGNNTLMFCFGMSESLSACVLYITGSWMM